MTRVLIRPDDGQPDSLKALLADISRAAGDERVRLESGGVAVSGEVALKYLNAKHGDADTSGRTVDNTREPLVTVHVDESTGAAENADDTSNRSTDLAVGGKTPEGAFPGGYEGVRADQREAAPAEDDKVTPAPAKKTTAAKKAAPAKTTAAAAQRASRTTRS